MRRRPLPLRPLARLAGPVLLLAPGLLFACGAPASPPAVAPVTTAPSAAAAPAPAYPDLSLDKTGIVGEWMDPSADACQDFYAYACGSFDKTASIPADRTSWGAIDALDKETEDFLHDILEKAKASPGDDPVLKKIGDYYAACTDEEGIEKLGAAPIKPLLTVVAGVHDVPSLAAAVTKLHAAGVFPLFDISQQQDFADATLVIAGLDQNGLGLPDRDYYLKDDGNQKAVREFYAGHVQRTLALVGLKGAELKAATDDAIARKVFGSPFMVVDGEPFWGMDRMDQFEKWLKTGGW